MKLLNFIFITIFALSTNMGYAAKITDDTLTIGRPGSSANKEISLGARKIRDNVSTGKLEFSNDGTLYKNLGSGSGSGDAGVNVLENASFEDGLTPGWTSVGGTFSQQTYTNGLEGDTKYARHVATVSGQYFESVAKIVTDNIGASCLAYSRYRTSDNNAYKISFFSAGTEISFQSLPTTNGAWLTTPYVPVLCPSAGTLVKVRFESLAAGTIEADKVYQGSENRLVKSSGSFLVGRVVFGNDCSMQRSTSGTFSDFPVDSTCTITPAGRALSPSTNIPAIRFSQLNAGTYQVVVSGPISCGLDSGGDCRGTLRMFDGTTESRELLVTESTQNGVTAGDESTGNNYTFTMVLPSNQSNVQLNLQGRTTLGNQIFNYSGDSLARTSISVFAVQTESDFAVTNDQSSWMIDVNIGGANPSLGTAAVSSYSEITNASLDMTLNSGSAPARIPCSSTNPATGLTCSAGSESLGVNFTNLTTGYFDVCAEYSQLQNIAASSSVNTAHQIVLTSNASQSILQEGKSRPTIGMSAASGGPETSVTPIATCGTFLLSDTSEKTIRLMYEQSVSGTVVTSQINADRAAVEGQRDIRITVRPSTMNVARPVLTGDQVTTPGASKKINFKMRSTALCTAGACAVENDSNITLSASFSSTGVYNATIPGGTCSATPYCTSGTIQFVSFSFRCQVAPQSATLLQISCYNSAGSAVNEGFSVDCSCNKP